MSVQEESSPQVKHGLIGTHQTLIVSASLVLMLLPFITTFNEFLTALVLRSQAYVAIQDFVVPIEGRMVATILQYVFGLNTVVSGSSLIILGARSLRVYISWNCIGWQSLILFAITLITGLQGPYTIRSKILCILAGIEGTIALNLLRIASVIVVALFWGMLPAVIFHDYGGTILVLIWLVAFWELSYRYILQHIDGA